MLDLKYTSEHSEEISKILQTRDPKIDLSGLKGLNDQRRSLLKEMEDLQAVRNQVSREIPELKKKGEDVQNKISSMKEVGDQISVLKEKVDRIELQINTFMMDLPNLPQDDVPEGLNEKQNVMVKTWGKPKEFSFEPKAHWDLGEALDILDFKRAAAMSGARFAVLKGQGALLEMALIRFMLDLHTEKHGYTPVIPPFLVSSSALTGTGQLPHFKEDLFKCEDHDLYMVPTAEVPLTNLHRQEILKETDLPLLYTAYTPCFRSEAGSWGKDTRGLIRQHQFNKVEMVKFTKPEDSSEEHERMVGDAEKVLQLLGLPYRVMLLCRGDMSFQAAKCYDLEVWLPAQNTYREISSVSNCTDFQARRAGIRFKEQKSGTNRFVHTLNGSGLAVGRTFVAILENGQQKDGSVLIPEVLSPYLNGLKLLEPA